MSCTTETSAAASEFTWSYGYDASEDTMVSSQCRHLRLMKASAGQDVMNDELGMDYETDREVAVKASRICLLPGELSDDDDDDKPTYPIVKGMCRWEYKGDGVAEAYKEMQADQVAAAMKRQQATIGTVLVDDCFGRAKLLSQPSGCDLVVSLPSTGEERQRTAWHLYVEEPDAPLLDGEDNDKDKAAGTGAGASDEAGRSGNYDGDGNTDASAQEERVRNQVDTTSTGADANEVGDADGGDNADADEQLAVRNELVSSLNRLGQDWGLDPAGTDVLFYRALVLVETNATGSVVAGGADGVQTTVPKISVGQIVRSCATGFFLK
eukprot:6204652-Pleurochrysis_carterae.AAC.1